MLEIARTKIWLQDSLQQQQARRLFQWQENQQIRSRAQQVGNQYGELDTLESPMTTMEIILIQHILDQSRFFDDLKPDLLNLERECKDEQA